jgi:hypothetical protein
METNYLFSGSEGPNFKMQFILFLIYISVYPAGVISPVLHTNVYLRNFYHQQEKHLKPEDLLTKWYLSGVDCRVALENTVTIFLALKWFNKIWGFIEVLWSSSATLKSKRN